MAKKAAAAVSSELEKKACIAQIKIFPFKATAVGASLMDPFLYKGVHA